MLHDKELNFTEEMYSFLEDDLNAPSSSSSRQWPRYEQMKMTTALRDEDFAAMVSRCI